MDFINLITTNTNISTQVNNIYDVSTVLIWTFLLSLIIAYTYKKTYKWEYYNQNFTQTIIILAVLISFVMLIVGNNIAWAFTLMWALSIIRFKNSLKDTRDIWFIFFAIAIWMAMGTKLYVYAITGTIIVSVIFFILFKFSLFKWEETPTPIDNINNILILEENTLINNPNPNEK